MSNKLMLFGEGDGDRAALPILVKTLIKEKNGWGAIYMDRRPPYKVGDLGGLVKDNFSKWKRFLKAALMPGGVGGILVVLDGDSQHYPPNSKQPFCAKVAALALANAATEVGAGSAFSLAIVFACLEFESWLIASAGSLAGKKLSDGRLLLNEGVVCPNINLETDKRGAKEWLSRNRSGGYNPARDQAALTEHVDFNLIRQRVEMRSFRRFEHAVEQLIAAMRERCHIVSPILADVA